MLNGVLPHPCDWCSTRAFHPLFGHQDYVSNGLYQCRFMSLYGTCSVFSPIPMYSSRLLCRFAACSHFVQVR